MFNVRLAGGHLYGKQLFTWLSLVVSLMTSFVLSFFPLDVLDEIWDLVESVSEGFLTYSCFIAITPSHLTINRTSVLRHHNSNFIPFSTGRDSFPKSLSRSMELTQLVSSKQDQTQNQIHYREIQQSGRSIIQNKQTDFHRRVSQSKNCQCNFYT